MKTKHCVQRRELPAGSRAGRSCSAVWGRKAGGLPAQPSPTAKPRGKAAFLPVFSALFQLLETLEKSPLSYFLKFVRLLRHL